MKRLLSIILLAAALAAAPAAGQTVKSLGYNTTNGQVVYSGTNPLTFTNSLQFATNARAATRTNLGATTVGNSVFTATNPAAAATAIGLGTTNEVTFSRVGVGGAVISTNSFSGGDFAVTADRALTFVSGGDPATTRTNLGLGATNNVTFSNITANGIVTANDSTATPATNAAAARGIQWPGLGGSQHAAIYGGYTGAAQIALAVGTSNSLTDVATFRSTGMTVASNAIVGGTLAVSNAATFSTNVTVTGNATLNGSDNLMPNATNAASASSLMTRDLGDARYGGPLFFSMATNAVVVTNSTNVVTVVGVTLPTGLYHFDAFWRSDVSAGGTIRQRFFNTSGTTSFGTLTHYQLQRITATATTTFAGITRGSGFETNAGVFHLHGFVSITAEAEMVIEFAQNSASTNTATIQNGAGLMFRRLQ